MRQLQVCHFRQFRPLSHSLNSQVHTSSEFPRIAFLKGKLNCPTKATSMEVCVSGPGIVFHICSVIWTHWVQKGRFYSLGVASPSHAAALLSKPNFGLATHIARACSWHPNPAIHIRKWRVWRLLALCQHHERMRVEERSPLAKPTMQESQLVPCPASNLTFWALAVIIETSMEASPVSTEDWPSILL